MFTTIVCQSDKAVLMRVPCFPPKQHFCHVHKRAYSFIENGTTIPTLHKGELIFAERKRKLRPYEPDMDNSSEGSH